jgi:glycosyltransferase involved in cell wall biosynthesis
VLNLVTVGGHRWVTPLLRQEIDFPVAAGLAARLEGRHHVVGRAAEGDARTEHEGAVTLHLLASDTPTWAFVVRARRLVLRLLRELGPNVVLCTSDVAGALVSRSLVRRGNTRTVVQVQGGVIAPGAEYGSAFKRALIGAAMRSAVRHADGVRALNDRIAEEAARTGTRARVAVVGSRVDVRRFTPPEVRPRGTPRIGAVGRLVAVKNHTVLLSALAELESDGVAAQLVLVGDGPRREHLAREAKSLGIADRVELMGAIPHSRIADVLRTLAVFAQPSLSEGEPRALLEAQAVALPSVVSDIPAHRGIVRDSETAVIVDAHDASAWAKSIRMLIEDPERAARIGAAGRAVVCAEHEFDTLLDRFAAFIRDTATCASTA